MYDKLRKMVEAGYTMTGISEILSLDRDTTRALVRSLKETNKQNRQTRRKAKRANDFQLRDVPLGDGYSLSVGSVDRYLERLRKVHGEHGHKANRNHPRPPG